LEKHSNFGEILKGSLGEKSPAPRMQMMLGPGAGDRKEREAAVAGRGGGVPSPQDAENVEPAIGGRGRPQWQGRGGRRDTGSRRDTREAGGIQEAGGIHGKRAGYGIPAAKAVI